MSANMNKNRYAWVDIAKGIAIIAVVVGHVGYRWPNTKLLPLSDLCVWIWHVPVFFIIGGFFLKEEKLLMPVSFVKGKIKSLYLPMIYIYVPVLLLHNLFISLGLYDLNVEYYGKFVTLWGVGDFFKHLTAALLCAGREPLLGAMWFGFVLFMALCAISLTSWGLKRISTKWTNTTFEITRGLVFLSIAIVSCSLTKLFGFTIPRFNNTLVAIWLVYIGMLLMQKAKITFSNGLIAAGCALVAWHSATLRGGVNLVANDYSDVIVLTITSCACLYVVCYLSKKVERFNWIKKILSTVGKDSLYIMGFHFIGFKFATVLLNVCDYDANLADLIPNVGNNIFVFVIYTTSGVLIPVATIESYRIIKNYICKK